jgi:hypothetical protein
MNNFEKFIRNVLQVQIIGHGHREQFDHVVVLILDFIEIIFNQALDDVE